MFVDLSPLQLRVLKGMLIDYSSVIESGIPIEILERIVLVIHNAIENTPAPTQTLDKHNYVN